MANWYINEEGKYVVKGYGLLSPMTKDFFDLKFHKCEFCDDVQTEYNLYTDARSGKKVCIECFRKRGNVRCSECSNTVHKDDTTMVDGYVFCKNCLENSPSIKFCKQCGKPHLEWNMEFISPEEGFGCKDCIGPLFGCGSIRNYHSFKESKKFKFNDIGEQDKLVHPYMGFELEVDYGVHQSSTIDRINNILREYKEYGFLHYEHDGSLDEDGFEMISQPATLGWYIEHRDMLKDIFATAISSEYRSHDTSTCGLHVHIDRNFFEGDDKEASYKMAHLFNEFWKYFVKFSRRSEDSIDQWCSDYSDDAISDLRDGYLSPEDVGRYHAVNITNNNTIEIRIARGTLKLSTFFATLKLYDRIANIVKKSSYDEIDRLSWKDILGDDEEVNKYWEGRN